MKPLYYLITRAEKNFTNAKCFSLMSSQRQENTPNNGNKEDQKKSNLEDMKDKSYRLAGTDFKNLYHKGKKNVVDMSKVVKKVSQPLLSSAFHKGKADAKERLDRIEEKSKSKEPAFFIVEAAWISVLAFVIGYFLGKRNKTKSNLKV